MARVVSRCLQNTEGRVQSESNPYGTVMNELAQGQFHLSTSISRAIYRSASTPYSCTVIIVSIIRVW
jgi:hypothetical protein